MVRRSPRLTLNRIRRGAGYALATAMRMNRLRKGFTQARQKRPLQQADAPMTSQRDTRLMYRKKRMPYRKRKQWTSFKRKVTAVQISNTTLQTVVRQQVMYVTCAANRSSKAACTIYGMNGNGGSEGTTGTTSGIGQIDDMADIINAKYGTTSGPQKKLLFASACLDVHVYGFGSGPGILEVYEIVARKDFTPALATYDSPEDLYDQGYLDIATVGTTATSGTLGTTPFNCRLFCQHFKITKKYRVQYSQGETLSFQMRDPGNHFISGNILGKPSLGWKKGVTKGYFFQLYGSPSTTATNFTIPAEVRITAIKSYTYRQLDVENVSAGVVN